MTIDLFHSSPCSSSNPSRRPVVEARVSQGHANHRWGWIPLILALAFGVCGEAHGKAKQAEVPRLAFADFFEASSQEIKPSAHLLARSGQRVKLVGFMAKMEVAPKGAFYLTPRPVSCDEEGGGTADLPPEAVYVVVRSSAGQEIPHSPRALEVTGLLEVGYHVEADDRVTHIRLLLDRPQDLLGTDLLGTAPKRKRSPNPPEVRP